MTMLGVIKHSLSDTMDTKMDTKDSALMNTPEPAMPSISQQPPSKIKKILLGVVTYQGHSYCLSSFSAALKALRLPSGTVVDVLFVDTSDDESYIDALRDQGFTALWLGPGKRTRIQKIVDGRNMIRGIFLKQNYDALFFVDSDIILQQNALLQLLASQKDIVMGVYLHNTLINDAQHILPVVYVFHDKEKGLLRQLRQDEVIGGRLIKAAAGGMGCVLISREVLEKTPAFHTLSKNSTGGEDAAFYKDASTAGFQILCDTRVKCLHMPYPPGDDRNKYFQFRRKIVEYENTVTLG